jgi:hypothetical protein
MEARSQDRIYQRIGEFVVSFQWLENKLREIGWLILDPNHSNWPPTGLRNLKNERLINKVRDLFFEALPKCKLDSDLEKEFLESFALCVETLHQLRRDRNRILHSAFLELKAGGETQEFIRSNPRLSIDEETGEYLFDQECLKPDSFDEEMRKMASVAIILNRSYMQLIHHYNPDGDA